MFPGARSLLLGLGRALLHLVAPSECVGCGKALRGALCRECARNSLSVSERRVGGVRVLSAGVYGGPLARSIQAFKYHERTELVKPLASLLGPLADTLGRGAVLVPVPMHPERLAERGYNQAALLAGALGRANSIAVDYRLLQRVRQTGQQAGLGAAERRTNVQGSFSVRQRRPRRRDPVILVDDVVTTGATLLGCVEALNLAGYPVKGCIALARPKD